jgi:hypothetical protein
MQDNSIGDQKKQQNGLTSNKVKTAKHRSGTSLKNQLPSKCGCQSTLRLVVMQKHARWTPSHALQVGVGTSWVLRVLSGSTPRPPRHVMHSLAYLVESHQASQKKQAPAVCESAQEAVQISCGACRKPGILEVSHSLEILCHTFLSL